jgi:hypothetical protein
MYRNAAEILRARFFALVGEAEQLGLELAPGQIDRLPKDLRSRLDVVASRLLPEALAPAAMEDAERALEEHRGLLADAHEVMRSIRKAEKRRRREWKVRAWWLLPVAVVGGPIGVTLCTLPERVIPRSVPAGPDGPATAEPAGYHGCGYRDESRWKNAP